MTSKTVEPLPKGLERWLSRLNASAEAGLIPLTGDGSIRRYFRLDGTGLVALYGPDKAENLAWLQIGRHLWFKGLKVPRIFEHDLEAGFFLLEDLGDKFLVTPGHPAKRAALPCFRQAVEWLASLHNKGLDGFNSKWCHQTRAYDASMIKNQEVFYYLNSFLTDYLKWPRLPKGIEHEARDFSRLAAPSEKNYVLMHRDFQGRNLMLKNGQVYAIDWQGARLGSAAYDLSSLLNESPYQPFTGEEKEELISHYLHARGRGDWRKGFRHELTITGAARLMQALGAYGKLSLEGKEHFASYMPETIKQLAEKLQSPLLKSFPALRETALEASRQLPVNAKPKQNRP